LSSILKAFSKDKSPGPDGWIVEFFLHYFELVGEDLLGMVEESRRKGEVKSGFGLSVTNWIMSCVTSVSYAVLINGEPSDFFERGKGLRQGCPLSPLLFILVMEGLSILLKKEKEVSLLSGIKVARITKILHLLFVDDVLILTRACVAEWKVIVGLLKTFLHASGLEINVEKSTFHVAGVEESGLAPFKEFFPFNYVPIEYSFRYLGYFLKTNCYKAEVWQWLIKKFERRIDHWCNRWLSLGGRLVLIKVVLESQPVYWMSLAAVPNSVLVKLCQLIFSFYGRVVVRGNDYISVIGTLLLGLREMEVGGCEIFPSSIKP
jgi:hypothetical protein